MSLHRRNPATDENALMIIKALRSIGATVQPIIGTGKGGCPDILVGYKDETHLLEIKRKLTGKKGQPLKGTLQPAQAAWHAAWRGKPVSVVDSVAGAFIAVGSPYAVQLQRVFDKPKKTVEELPSGPETLWVKQTPEEIKANLIRQLEDYRSGALRGCGCIDSMNRCELHPMLVSAEELARMTKAAKQIERESKPKKTKTQQWAALGLSVFGDKPKKGQSNEENHENKT